MAFYLIETEDVGPNEKDSEGHWKGDTREMEIRMSPGTTNMSHEEKTSGWLGTTNDTCETAHGEFETIEEARAAAAEMGFVVESEFDECLYDDVVEVWVSESASRDQVDAGDWFLNGLGETGTCDEFGITHKTTDDEIEVMAKKAIDEAREDGVEIHGCVDLFTELRDGLVEV